MHLSRPSADRLNKVFSTLFPPGFPKWIACVTWAASSAVGSLPLFGTADVQREAAQQLTPPDTEVLAWLKNEGAINNTTYHRLLSDMHGNCQLFCPPHPNTHNTFL